MLDTWLGLCARKSFLLTSTVRFLMRRTYQASPADSLLEMLDNLGVPVVFNSSKTFPEMLKIRRLLGNHQPFVVENGSAVYVPFDHDIAGAEGLETIDGYRRYVLGTARQRLREFSVVGLGVQLCGVDRYVRTRGCFGYWPDAV